MFLQNYVEFDKRTLINCDLLKVGHIFNSH